MLMGRRRITDMSAFGEGVPGLSREPQKSFNRKRSSSDGFDGLPLGPDSLMDKNNEKIILLLGSGDNKDPLHYGENTRIIEFISIEDNHCKKRLITALVITREEYDYRINNQLDKHTGEKNSEQKQEDKK